jgi:nucleotide-binding universal stress UspA family protein
MSANIIVSYDGTANEDDAIALGRLFGRAGAEVALAYVRHVREADSERENQAERQAHGLLEGGVELLGNAHAQLHVITDRSTPEGLAKLAEREGAQVIVFCSDSHTAKGSVSIGNSAERLLEGGRTAVAIAPVDLAERVDAGIQRIVAVGDGEGGARQTAESLARALGATVEPVAGEQTDLLVIDSRPEAEQGRVSLSSSAMHLIEIATSAVLVLPRGMTLQFATTTAPTPATPVGA